MKSSKISQSLALPEQYDIAHSGREIYKSLGEKRHISPSKQAIGINHHDRIVLDVRKEIHIPTPKPQRIFGDEPPHGWIIVLGPHVVKTVFRLSHDAVLAHELEWLGDGFLLIKDPAEGFVGVAVYHILVHISQGRRTPGGVEMVAVAGGRRLHGKKSLAVDVFAGDPARVRLGKQVSPGVVDVAGFRLGPNGLQPVALPVVEEFHVAADPRKAVVVVEGEGV